MEKTVSYPLDFGLASFNYPIGKTRFMVPREGAISS